MFDDLYDAISFLWSWRWPTAEGEITAIDVERIRHARGRATVRLAIAYEFSIGSDGPYTGESFWEPSFFAEKRVRRAQHKIHIRQSVTVRYRSDDPSVSRLDRSVWQDL